MVVSLGLDTAAFDAGITNVNAELKRLREGVTKTTVDIQTTGKKTVETFSGMKIGVLEMAAALIGAIKLLEQFRGTAENLRAIGVAARNLGISVQDLGAFRNAVAANGGNADQAAASFQHLADAMARFALTGKTELLPFLNEIGGNLGDNAMQTYMKFVEWASRQGGNIGRIRLIGQGLGLDEGSIQLALKGVAGVQKELSEARRRGLPTEKDAKVAADLAKSFTELEQAINGVYLRLFRDFAPMLTKVLDTIKELIVANPKMADSLFAIGGALGVIAALKLPGWLLRGLGGGAAAAGGAAGAAASGGFWSFLRRWGPLALLGLTGPAGGVDNDPNKPGTQGYADRLAREAWERAHPGQRAATGFWDALGRFFGITPSAPSAPAAPAGTGPGGTGTRGFRNNNPLNLSYVPGQGAIASDGRFGQYATMEGGIAAAHRQLLRYQDRGLNTLDAIIRTWAPPSENDTEGYIRQVSAWTGFRRDQVLDMRDPATAQAVISAMSRIESGALDPELVRRGIAESQRQTGAPAALPAIPSPQAAQRSILGGQGLQASAAPSFSIGQLVVNTRATDAAGIARDIGAELQRVATVTQANRGLA